MKLLLTGDYFYDYETTRDDFELIKKELKIFDYSIINYEGSLMSNNVRDKAVNLSMSKHSLELENNNILFCLANNHIFDYGIEGYRNTIALVNQNGYSHFGLESKKNTFNNYLEWNRMQIANKHKSRNYEKIIDIFKFLNNWFKRISNFIIFIYFFYPIFFI